jgi:hypothetical protein
MATITYTVTVAFDGTANIYYLDGSAKPALSFSRGNTYEFDLSDGSNSGHPLAFKDVSGNSYTTGVTTTGTAGSAGAKVSIVVDGATPSNLRYYCTVHGNYMGNTILVAYNADYVAIYGTGKYGTALYGIASGLATLTGVAGTGAIESVAVNTFEIDVSEALDSVSATGSIGSLTVTGTANQTLSSVSATGSANAASVSVSQAYAITIADGDDIEATGAVNTVTVNITEKLDSVSATGVINGAGLDIRSINYLSLGGVSGTGAVGSVGVSVTVTVTGVSATGAVNTVTENPSEALASVSATGSIGTPTYQAIANFTVTGVEATGQIESVAVNSFEVDVQERLNSVSATGSIGTLTVNVTDLLSGVAGTTALGTITATGVTFAFVAANYSRARTAFVERNDTSAERRAAA